MSRTGRSGAAPWRLPAYLAVALALTWPLAAQFGRAIPAVFGGLDPLLQSFLLGWNWQILATDPARLFQLPIFHPHARALTYMDTMTGEALAAWPVLALTGNPAAAYNVLILLSFALSAWGVDRLLRGMGASRPAAFLGGLLFALGPYRFANLGNLNQMMTQFLPLGIHLGFRFYRKRRTADLAAVLAVPAVQAWFGWYYFFHLSLALALLFAWELGAGRLRWRARRPWPVVGLLLASAVIIVPCLYPYWQQQQAMPEFRRTLGMTALWSADLLDYLGLNVENAWGLHWPGGSRAQSYWPGLLAAPLAFLGLMSALRGSWRIGPAPDTVRLAHRRGDAPARAAGWLTVRLVRWLAGHFQRFVRRTGEPGYFALLGFSAFVLSLGPVLQVGGQRTLVPLPFGLCFFLVPGFSSMRAPGRFAGLVLLAAAVLAAIGFVALCRRLQPRVRRRLLFGGAVAITLTAAWSSPIPLIGYPHQASMPPAYAWLAAQPDRAPLLELPMPAHVTDENPTHARRQHWLLYHRHPRLDGVSGFVPPDYDLLRIVMQGFPRPGTLAAASRYGARWILVHYDDWPPAVADSLRAAAAARPELVNAAEFGGDVVYRLESTPLTR